MIYLSKTVATPRRIISSVVDAFSIDVRSGLGTSKSFNPRSILRLFSTKNDNHKISDHLSSSVSKAIIRHFLFQVCLLYYGTFKYDFTTYDLKRCQRFVLYIKTNVNLLMNSIETSFNFNMTMLL